MLRIDHDTLREMSVELEAIAKRTTSGVTYALLAIALDKIREAVRREQSQALYDCGATSILGGEVVDLTRESSTIK